MFFGLGFWFLGRDRIFLKLVVGFRLGFVLGWFLGIEFEVGVRCCGLLRDCFLRKLLEK